jgi:hypothetical protein
MERRTHRHHWTEQDDIVALYFYKFGDEGRTSNLATVGERRGMGAGSLRMRVGNFRAIARRAFGPRSFAIALNLRTVCSFVRTRTPQTCRFVTRRPKNRDASGGSLFIR